MDEAALAGRVAIVTGGGTGIGRDLCLRFAALGMKVVAAGRTLATCAAVAEAARAAGGEALALQTDVSVPDQVRRMVAETVSRLGTVDVLVNNAGAMSGSSIADCDDRTARAVIDSSVMGTFFCTRECMRVMKQRRRGHIINIASQAAGWPSIFEGIYGTAKAAQVMLSLKTASELGFHEQLAKIPERSFFCHAICPGGVDTPAQEHPDRAKLLGTADVTRLVVDVLLNPQQGLEFFAKRSQGRPYRVGALSLFDPDPSVLWIHR
jgi:NAD(P)-dependent dehydrogenase (short-subunit alcohol dehydrogenase family)